MQERIRKIPVGRSYQLFRRGIKSNRTLEFYRLSMYYFCKFAHT